MKHEMIDVLIVGAGPSGLSAALELKRLGVENVVVAEREPEPGGMPRFCHHTGFGIRDLHRIYSGPRYADYYVQQAKHLNIDIRTATTITDWEDNTTLKYTSPQGLGIVEAKSVLLATGVRERPRSARLTPGSRPGGVFTTGSLQRFVYEKKMPVGKRAVIIGAELVSLSAFTTLKHAGLEVVALVTELPRHQISFPFNIAKWGLMDLLGRTPLYTSTDIQEIVGRKRVQSIRLSHSETEKVISIDCDTVVFTGGWIPEYEIARLGGIKINAGTLGPQADSRFRTSQQGVFAAGNLLHGAETADTSALEGRSAAGYIKKFLGSSSWIPESLPIVSETPLSWVFPNNISSDDRSSLRHLNFRVSKVLRKPTIKVYQSDRLLHTQTFRQLLPENTFRLNAQWVTDIDFEAPPLKIVVES